MTRTLSITLDDDTSMMTVEGEYLFSLLEVYGIAEHLNIRTRLKDIARIQDAEKQAARRQFTVTPKRKPATKKRRTK